MLLSRRSGNPITSSGSRKQQVLAPLASIKVKKNQPTVHGACFVKQPGTVMESDEFWSGWALLSRLLPGCWCLLQQVGGEDSGQVSQETGGARRGHSESVVEC